VEKLRDLADGDWQAGIDPTKEGYSLYVMTDAGISATATFTVMRIKPYLLE